MTPIEILTNILHFLIFLPLIGFIVSILLPRQKENLISRCCDYQGTVQDFINDLVEENPYPMKFNYPFLGIINHITTTPENFRNLLTSCLTAFGLELCDQMKFNFNWVDMFRLEVN